jgi:hypothetical protein
MGLHVQCTVNSMGVPTEATRATKPVDIVRFCTNLYACSLTPSPSTLTKPTRPHWAVLHKL